MSLFGDMAMEGLKKTLINPAIKGIGEITDITFKNRELRLTLLLDGLEDKPVEVICRSVFISPAGDSVTVGDFSSNMPFAQNALNRFAARTYEVPDNPLAKTALKTARKFMGL